jgi:hypothetical protein
MPSPPKVWLCGIIYGNKESLLGSEFKQRGKKMKFLSRKMQQRLYFLPNN